MKLLGQEIVQLLAENEVKVGKLYEAIAENSRLEIGKEFFLGLAKDEYRHGNYFSRLLEEENFTNYENPSEEKMDYVNYLMKTNVLRFEEELIQKAKTIWKEEDCYIIADKIEREIILLVRELIDLYPGMAPEVMEKVLLEEKSHLLKVNRAYDKYREKHII